MQILSIDGDRAIAEALGVRREISLALLAPPKACIHDFVMVHVGYAIESIDPTLAAESHVLWQAMQAKGKDSGHA